MITKPTTLMEYLEYFMSNRRKLCEIGEQSQLTLATYISREKHLRAFLSENNLDGCKPSIINIHIIREYKYYLLGPRKLSNNCAMRSIRLLDQLLCLALENGDVLTNPADLFKYTTTEAADISYLELLELEQIRTLKLKYWLNITQSYFLFGCYTGLAFVDIYNFDWEKHIIKGPGGAKWIHVKRQKSNIDSYIPLLPEAEEILRQFEYKMPKRSNQKINKGLKKIAEMLGLKQVLTSHVARKTFGNILHNEMGVPLETVSKMLGHKSIITTQKWYVRINLKKIASDMKGISFTIPQSDQQEAA